MQQDTKVHQNLIIIYNRNYCSKIDTCDVICLRQNNTCGIFDHLSIVYDTDYLYAMHSMKEYTYTNVWLFLLFGYRCDILVFLLALLLAIMTICDWLILQIWSYSLHI